MKNFKYHKKLMNIEDSEFINMAVMAYSSGNFKQMKSIITDYGDHCFFRDLYQFLDNSLWRNDKNKYLIFVGITIQYFKIYS